MASWLDYDWFAITNVASGVAFVLAAWALSSSKDQSLRRGLSAFLMTWGVQVVLSNIASATPAQDPTPAEAFLGPLAAFLVVLQPITLLYFVFLLRPDGVLTKWNRLAFAGLLVTLATGAIAFGFLLVSTPLIVGDGAPRVWGPLAPLLLQLPQFATYVFALFLMGQILSASRSPVHGGPRLFVGLWLPIAAATTIGLFITFTTYGATSVATGGPGFANAYLAILGSSALGLVAVAVWYALRSRQWWIAGMSAVPILVCLPMLSLSVAGPASVLAQVGFSPGLYRLVGLGVLLAYAWRAPVQASQAEPSGTSLPMRQFVPVWITPVVTALALLAFFVPLGRSSGADPAAMLAVGTGFANIAWFLSSDGAAPVRDVLSYRS